MRGLHPLKSITKNISTALGVGIVSVILVGSPAFAAIGDVVISEFMADPVTITDANGEWIELENKTDSNIDISGWKLDDGGPSFTFPPLTTIDANGFLVVCRNSALADANCDEQWSGMSLNNSGIETITLTDKTPEVVDTLQYEGSDVTPGASTEDETPTEETPTLSANTTDVYTTDNTGTPGEQNRSTFPVRNIDSGKYFLQIQEAIDDVDTLDNQTIEVNDGIYEPFKVLSSSDENLTIKAASGANPVVESAAPASSRVVDLRGIGTTVEGFVIRSLQPGNGVVVYLDGDNNTIRNNMIEGSSSTGSVGVMTANSSNPTGNNTITGNVIDAIRGVNFRNTGNTFRNNDVTSSYKALSSEVSGNTIEFNNFINTAGTQVSTYNSIELLVENNWWGQLSGIGTISGDGSVDSDPWLCQPFEAGTTASVDGSCPVVDTTKPTGSATYTGDNEVDGVVYVRSIDNLSFTETIEDNHSVVRSTFLVQKLNPSTEAFEGFCGNWNASSLGSNVLGGSTEETYTETNVGKCSADQSRWTDGTYKIFHGAYDTAGNEEKYNANRQIFVIDSTAPNISWQKQPLALYGSSDGFHVRPITAEVGIAKSVYINSIAPENLCYERVDTQKNMDTKNTNCQALWDSLPDGTHKFVAVFEDYAGNETTSDSSTFVVDRTGPEVSGVMLNGQNVAASDIRNNNCDAVVNFYLISDDIELEATVNDALSDTETVRFKVRKVNANGCSVSSVFSSSFITMLDEDEDDAWTMFDTFDTSTLPSDGTYTVMLQTTDSAGNTTTSYIDIEVDNTPPTQPQVLGIFKGHNSDTENFIGCGGYTNTTQIRIDWQDNPESDIDYYWFGTKANQKHKKVLSTSYDGNMTPGNNPYYYTVIAVDKAGNESVVSDQCGLTLDTEAPDAMNVSPFDGAVVNGASITQAWGSSASDVDYYVYESYNDADGTDLRWTSTHTTDSKTATNVAEATYWWRVKAVDVAGNESPWTNLWKITVDNTKPSALITSPTNGAVLQDSFAVEGTASDAQTDIDMVEYTVTKIDAIGGSYDSNVSSGTASYDNATDTFNFSLSGLSNGFYRLKIQAFDQGGNWKYHYVDVQVDVSKPAATITAPFTGDVLQGSFPVTGTAVDAETEIDRVEYRVNVITEIGGTYVSSARSGLSTYDPLTDTFAFAVSGLVDGFYRVQIRAYDLAGNVRYKTVDVTVDNTAPVAGFVTLETTDTSPELSGTIDDDTAKVEVTIEGNTYEALVSTGTWTITQGTISPALAVGSYDVKIVSTDIAGNENDQLFTNGLVIQILPEEDEDDSDTLGANDDRTPVSRSPVNEPVSVEPTNTGVGGEGFEPVETTNTTEDTETNIEDEEEPQVLQSSVENSDAQSEGSSDEDSSGDDDGCFTIFGICWYWWIPVGLVVGYVIYRLTRKEDE